METFLVKALQLILSLSILVLVHEFGHFIFARIFKVRVEKFYLFFDPWFSIFKFKPKNSDTEYGVGWLPLGGYCKISGMIDESMDCLLYTSSFSVRGLCLVYASSRISPSAVRAGGLGQPEWGMDLLV